MVIDIFVTGESERVMAIGNTDEGEEFIDAWSGALLEVIDSGSIVIPREVEQEFTKAAIVAGMKVERP